MAIPLPVITNGFRLAHNYATVDGKFTNVFWLLSADTTDAVSVGTVFIDAYQNVTGSFSMKSLHSSDVTFGSCDVTPLDGSSPTANVPYSAGVHGGGSSPCSAANSCLVITWETGIRGRNHRGRSFLGGIPAASLESGAARWGAGLITDANDAVDGFINGLAGGDPSLQLLVVSQRAESGPSHHIFDSALPRRKVGSQRRRTERA